MSNFSPENKFYIVPKQYLEDVDNAIAEHDRGVDAPWAMLGLKPGPFHLPRVETPVKKLESILWTRDHGDEGRKGHADHRQPNFTKAKGLVNSRLSRNRILIPDLKRRDEPMENRNTGR